MVLCVLIIVAITTVFFEKHTHISATPVLPWTRRQVMSLLKEFKPEKPVIKVADLGCGWGGMIGKLGKLYPAAQITGYELSPFPYWFSKLRFGGYKNNITINQLDFFKENLSSYDVIFCYLSPNHMEELKLQLAGLKSGSLVISCSFPLLDWTPIATRSIWSIVKIPVYLYRIKSPPHQSFL